jgi:hypothetical protein
MPTDSQRRPRSNGNNGPAAGPVAVPARKPGRTVPAPGHEGPSAGTGPSAWTGLAGPGLDSCLHRPPPPLLPGRQSNPEGGAGWSVSGRGGPEPFA